MRRHAAILGLLVAFASLLLSACTTSFPGRGATTPSAQTYISSGFAALRAGDWESAKASFSAGLEQETQRPDALAGRGWAVLALEQFPAAIADFDAALLMDPENASAWAGRGRANLKLGNDQAAIEDLERALELSPLRAEAYTDRGLAYYHLGQYEAAILDFTRSIRSDARTARPYYNRGLAYLATEDNDLAIADFSQYLQLYPESTAALRLRAQAYEAAGKADLALADLTQAIAQSQGDPDNYLARAGFLYRTQQYTAAVDDFTQAMRLMPEDAPERARAAYRRALTFLKLDDQNRALTDMSEAQRIDPADPVFWSERGLLYYQTGQYPDAVSDLSQALELDPADMEALYWRGQSYYHLGEYELSAADLLVVSASDSGRAAAASYASGLSSYHQHQYAQAVEQLSAAVLAEGQPEQYYQRGLAYYHQGLFAKAAADFSAALQVGYQTPSNALYYRGRSAYKQEDYSQARADLSDAITQGYSNPDRAYYYLGLAAYRQAEYKNAVDAFSKAMDNGYEPQTVAFRRRGLAYYHMQMYDQAQCDFDKALTGDPQDAVAYIYRGLSSWHLSESDPLPDGVYQSVLSDLNRALTLRPPDVADRLSQTILYARARLYYQQGDYPHARADLALLLENNPMHDGGHYYAGLVEYKTNHYQAAIEHFTKAISTAPERTWAIYYRGLAYRRLGQNAQARSDLLQVIQVGPGTRPAELAAYLLEGMDQKP